MSSDTHSIESPSNCFFYFNRQCNARAQLTHTLTHWRYHLNEWVIDFLERTGHMDADEILRRNDMSVKRKTRNANDVLDSMTGSGEVDKLWRDFHIKLKSAREKEVCSCSGVSVLDANRVCPSFSLSTDDEMIISKNKFEGQYLSSNGFIMNFHEV